MTTETAAQADNLSEEKEKQAHYELLYIIPVKYTVDELPAIKDKIRGFLTEHQASLTHEEDLDKRKLAYPIKQVYHGFYGVMEFNLPTRQLKSLNTSLRLAGEVLRHLIVVKKVRTATEIALEKTRRAKAEAAEEEKLKDKIKAQTPTSPKAFGTEKPAEVKKDSDKGKLSLEELDKKLDELIDESIL
ncbi:MAG: 30S ribosomal protein S6 [Patescibacteria group bacterium]